MRTLYAFFIVYFILWGLIIIRRIKKCKAENTRFDGYDFAGTFLYSLGVALALGIFFMFSSSSVAIVYEKDGSWKHDSDSYFLYYSYNKDGVSVSAPAKIGGHSLFNASDKTLVLHPVIYGSPSHTESYQPRTILPHEYVRTSDYPFYFTSPPQMVRTKSSGKVEWVLLEEGEEVQEPVNYLRVHPIK